MPFLTWFIKTHLQVSSAQICSHFHFFFVLFYCELNILCFENKTVIWRHYFNSFFVSFSFYMANEKCSLNDYWLQLVSQGRWHLPELDDAGHLTHMLTFTQRHYSHADSVWWNATYITLIWIFNRNNPCNPLFPNRMSCASQINERYELSSWGEAKFDLRVILRKES